MYTNSVNEARLIGTVGTRTIRDAGTRQVNGATVDQKVLALSVATRRRAKDKTGQFVDYDTWHNVSYFTTSEWVMNNIQVGDTIQVTGRIDNTQVEKAGVKTHYSNIIAETIGLLRKKGSSLTGATGDTAVNEGGELEPTASGVDTSDDLPF